MSDEEDDMYSDHHDAEYGSEDEGPGAEELWFGPRKGTRVDELPDQYRWGLVLNARNNRRRYGRDFGELHEEYLDWLCERQDPMSIKMWFDRRYQGGPGSKGSTVGDLFQNPRDWNWYMDRDEDVIWRPILVEILARYVVYQAEHRGGDLVQPTGETLTWKVVLKRMEERPVLAHRGGRGILDEYGLSDVMPARYDRMVWYDYEDDYDVYGDETDYIYGYEEDERESDADEDDGTDEDDEVEEEDGAKNDLPPSLTHQESHGIKNPDGGDLSGNLTTLDDGYGEGDYSPESSDSEDYEWVSKKTGAVIDDVDDSMLFTNEVPQAQSSPSKKASTIPQNPATPQPKGGPREYIDLTGSTSTTRSLQSQNSPGDDGNANDDEPVFSPLKKENIQSNAPAVKLEESSTGNKPNTSAAQPEPLATPLKRQRSPSALNAAAEDESPTKKIRTATSQLILVGPDDDESAAPN
ncbi:hypothetical protein M426DRAFT_267080 [Hypoxylon sp. CI-4A]|nr:hypothetical protein M426DRAFT_267080 [Hypoxylon sp. CI-4A]